MIYEGAECDQLGQVSPPVFREAVNGFHVSVMPSKKLSKAEGNLESVG